METAEIESPGVDTDVAEKSDVSLINSKTLNLNKIDLKDLALAQFGDWQADVASVTKQLTGVVHDLSTQAKVDEAKSLRFRLIGKPRATVRTVTKALKSKLASVSKAVGAEEDLAIAAYDESEKLITPQIEAREAVIEAERVERARIEAERIQGLRDKIAAIRGFVEKCHGISAERIAKGIDLVAKLDTSKTAFAELDAAALAAQVETLQAMRTMHAAAVEREAEAARVEAQRVENERVAAELKAKADAMASQQAAIDKAAAELKAAQDAAAKAAQEKLDEQARTAKAIADAQMAIDASRIKNGASGQPAKDDWPVVDAEIDQPAIAQQVAVDTATVAEVAPEPEPEIKLTGRMVSVPQQITASPIEQVVAAAPVYSPARVELNAVLDDLTDAQLPRITSFVRSRYPSQLAA